MISSKVSPVGSSGMLSVSLSEGGKVSAMVKKVFLTESGREGGSIQNAGPLAVRGVGGEAGAGVRGDRGALRSKGVPFGMRRVEVVGNAKTLI